jgi:PAS domain S-box-containing protein
MTYTPLFDDVEEIKRLQTLLSYNILDTPPEQEFDSLVELISVICNSPVAIISMIDDKRQWYKAKTGLTQNEVPRSETFCQFTLQQDDILEISDAREDERVKDNHHVTPKDGIRYYAGVNLKSSNGYKIGTVCVVDTKPKILNEDQKKALRLIADQTMILLETRKKNKELSKEIEQIINDKISDAQKQLLQKETEYNLLLKAIKKSNGVVEFSSDGIIREANKNFLKIVGYSKEEVVGKHHRILLDDEERSKNIKFWSFLLEGNFYSGKLKRKNKEGDTVWIQATYNPIIDRENKVTRVIKIAQDITKEIEAEKSLKNSKEMAENLNIQKDNFIANMSHEIRTPIHAILGFTELLLEQEDEPSKKSYLESVKTAGDNLLFVINDILDLSKIEAGIIQLEKEPFDLITIVKNVFSILHLKAHQKKISFKYHIDPEVNSHLEGDKNRLSQILINLLGNAIKFTASGSVTLYITRLKKKKEITTLQFKVVDTGIGIPEGKIESIFDRFSQAEENTSRTFGGTGLGLNISHQLIERQGGKISVESEPGKGSVFSFYLPFKIGTWQPITKETYSYTIPAIIRKANILLCEDNELNQRLIKAILSEKGYKIDLAENGEKGIDLFKNNNYDLVLMDIQMPFMDGYETTRTIRQTLQSKIPIVALTANFMIAEKTKCLQIGMNDYLSKPFSKEDLMQKVDRWLTETAENQAKAKKMALQKFPILSLETLQELSGGNKEFENEMICLFLDQAKKMNEELKIFSSENDILGIRSTAHKMKTSFGIIGADQKFLNELENLPENNLNPNELFKILASLENQLNEIYRILNNLINAPDDEDPTS